MVIFYLFFYGNIFFCIFTTSNFDTFLRIDAAVWMLRQSF
ncbi:hypothetical protein LT85_3319 [Collimonas arenae]|uniref:Uncharacterized protein n=1 Tax=Collimonas arenae TaxID=279058 RepID=A0A0A1FHU2_9BURK|nr:hypothetical protein LT85_3319 [Collimonas arenae]